MGALRVPAVILCLLTSGCRYTGLESGPRAPSAETAALPPSAAVPDKTRSHQLWWADEETGKALFTVGDIVRFDWDRQVFELTRDRAMDLLAWMTGPVLQHRGFVVRDREGVIYRGHFVQAISSMGYFGPSIIDMESRPPLFTISGGYPSGGGPRDRDRFSPRLLAALKKARALGAIHEARTPAPIDSIYTDLCGERDGLLVRVQYFPETFRIGGEARAHVFFTPSASAPTRADQLEISFSLVGNGGKFRSKVVLNNIPVAVISEGVQICKFRPWEAAPGSEERSLKPGPGQIAAVVSLGKQEGDEGRPVRKIEIPAREVTILPPK